MPRGATTPAVGGQQGTPRRGAIGGPGRSLLDLGGLLMDLQDLLRRDVDLVTEGGLRPRVAKRAPADAVER